jgi:hypothetical protein
LGITLFPPSVINHIEELTKNICRKHRNYTVNVDNSIELRFETLKLHRTRSGRWLKDVDDADLHRDLRWPSRGGGACGG